MRERERERKREGTRSVTQPNNINTCLCLCLCLCHQNPNYNGPRYNTIHLRLFLFLSLLKLGFDLSYLQQTMRYYTIQHNSYSLSLLLNLNLIKYIILYFFNLFIYFVVVVVCFWQSRVAWYTISENIVRFVWCLVIMLYNYSIGNGTRAS